MKHLPLSTFLRTLLATLLAATMTLATACSSSDEEAQKGPDGQDLTSLDVSLGWINNVEWAGFWLADQNGYFTDEGLDINWIPGGPNAPKPMQVLASGEADLGIIPDMAQWMATFSDGNDWTAVGSVFQDSPGALVSLPDHPVRTIDDLKGQTVLGQEGTQILYDAAFRNKGMEPNVKFTPVGYDISPLIEKQGVAYTAYVTNQPGMLEEQYGMSPDDYIVTKWSELGLPAYANIIFGTSDFVKANGDLVEKFLRAALRGWMENAKDPEVAANLAVNNYGPDLGLDINQQIRENQDQQALVEGDDGAPLLSMDPEKINTEMYPWMEVAGYHGLPDARETVDMTYLDAARAGLDDE